MTIVAAPATSGPVMTKARYMTLSVCGIPLLGICPTAGLVDAVSGPAATGVVLLGCVVAGVVVASWVVVGVVVGRNGHRSRHDGAARVHAIRRHGILGNLVNEGLTAGRLDRAGAVRPSTQSL